MQFNNKNRNRIKEENPDAGFAEIAQLVSKEWKALEADEKKKYEDLAGKCDFYEPMLVFNQYLTRKMISLPGIPAKDKTRYQEEMKSYTPPAGLGKESKTAKGVYPLLSEVMTQRS